MTLPVILDDVNVLFRAIIIIYKENTKSSP